MITLANVFCGSICGSIAITFQPVIVCACLVFDQKKDCCKFARSQVDKSMQVHLPTRYDQPDRVAVVAG